MNQFPFENLGATEFEDLVISICKEVLGIGCKTFSDGRDGAKDSWFEGTAQYFPDDVSPWKGVFNIQAKHTKIYNSSCSDNDFYVNKSSVIDKEIKRLKEVMVDTPFDNYIIFTNRKLSGGTHPLIVKKLKEELGLINVEVIGREDLDAYLKDYPNIAYKFGLYKFIAPLRFYEKDLRDVIVNFDKNKKPILSTTQNYISTFGVIDKDEKNKLNNLSQDYFDFLKNHSLQYFEEIEGFLKDPKNEPYRRMYSNTISDLQAIITIERNRFNEFEHIIHHLVQFTVGNSQEELKDLRQIVRVFIHFMYFNCDIGKKA